TGARDHHLQRQRLRRPEAAPLQVLPVGALAAARAPGRALRQQRGPGLPSCKRVVLPRPRRHLERLRAEDRVRLITGEAKRSYPTVKFPKKIFAVAVAILIAHDPTPAR